MLISDMTPSHISPKITDHFSRMNVLFSSLDDLIEKIDSIGRDAFVAQIANSPDMYRSTRDPSRRKSKNGDNDGVIYLLICLVNKKVYVGQTCNFDVRMRDHF